jgi:hypothetical protein
MNNTDDLLRVAAEELATGKHHEGLRLRAFVKAKGDEGKTKALYLKWRAKELAALGREQAALGREQAALGREQAQAAKIKASERLAERVRSNTLADELVSYSWILVAVVVCVVTVAAFS